MITAMEVNFTHESKIRLSSTVYSLKLPSVILSHLMLIFELSFCQANKLICIAFALIQSLFLHMFLVSSPLYCTICFLKLQKSLIRNILTSFLYAVFFSIVTTFSFKALLIKKNLLQICSSNELNSETTIYCAEKCFPCFSLLPRAFLVDKTYLHRLILFVRIVMLTVV